MMDDQADMSDLVDTSHGMDRGAGPAMSNEPLSIACPVCGAGVGDPCRTPLDYPMPEPHAARRRSVELTDRD